MFQHLLLPIDGSEGSRRAIDAGIGLAARLGASVTAFVAEPAVPPPIAACGEAGHVRRREVHDRQTAAHAQALIEAVKATAAQAGVPCDGHYLRTSQVAPAILDAAREHGCDLIVMATRLQGLLAGRFSPSHTRAVMARSRLPLLVVH